MEIQGGINNKGGVLATEFFGTSLFILCLNWGLNSSTFAYSTGFSYFLLVLLFGEVSGGHFNPALTLGTLFKTANKKDNWRDSTVFALLIILAQFFGAIFGICVCSLAFWLGSAKYY